MPARYAVVNQHDEEQAMTPTSPPPSFRSRHNSTEYAPANASHDLNDAFDDGSDSDAENDSNDRQRLINHSTAAPRSPPTTTITSPLFEQEPQSQLQPTVRTERVVTQLPAFQPQSNAPRAMPSTGNDGVFANLSAKPRAGELPTDDKPPTYEQAAADSTPPYWETTVLAPGMNSDDVYINGLPVGSVFSFIWNGMISMSFLFPGFLLTYLLHTTHAAKNGSLAGLGLTLVQYGFYMRGGNKDGAGGDAANPGQFAGTPGDPNSHDFDPSNPAGGTGGTSASGFGSADLVSYGLMIVGWFILIRAVSGFLRARREEQLVLQSPARGLNVPVVADGEGAAAV